MVSRNILGFSVASNMMRVMECNGFYASIMRADKKKKDDDGLPLGMPIPCLPVDYLKERPDFWVGGEGSYVCPVDSNWGLWFNFSMNNWTNTAILASVKGMNPVTGQRINGLSLEQYKMNCPVHNEKFKHGKFCKKCGFEWPDQNFLSNPTPFYMDGFRTSDGKVRQFYFTEEMSKSIPELVIGKDDTVPAFGFCFYNLKDMKSKYEECIRLKDKQAEHYFNHYTTERVHRIKSSDSITKSSGGGGFSGFHSVYCSTTDEVEVKHCSGTIFASSCNTDYMTLSNSVGKDDTANCFFANSSSSKSIKAKGQTKFELTMGGTIGLGDSSPTSKLIIRKSAEVGIGAGEEIDQSILKDNRSVDVWQDKPAAIFRIYFVFQEQFEKYVEAGLNILKVEKEGFLSGCPVGGVE